MREVVIGKAAQFPDPGRRVIEVDAEGQQHVQRRCPGCYHHHTWETVGGGVGDRQRHRGSSGTGSVVA